MDASHVVGVAELGGPDPHGFQRSDIGDEEQAVVAVSG
jgi:hypothetical protein